MLEKPPPLLHNIAHNSGTAYRDIPGKGVTPLCVLNRVSIRKF